MSRDEGAPESLVSVVMVTHNSSAALQWSLPKLLAFPHVVIVDNASGDNTVAMIRQQLPHATIIASRENLGFGRGNNLGLERVDTPFALLLNPDCTLCDGALAELVLAAKRYPEAAMLSARLYNPDGTAERSYDRAFLNDAGRGPQLEPCGDLCAEFLVGTGLMLRMDALRKIGLL